MNIRSPSPSQDAKQKSDAGATGLRRDEQSPDRRPDFQQALGRLRRGGRHVDDATVTGFGRCLACRVCLAVRCATWMSSMVVTQQAEPNLFMRTVRELSLPGVPLYRRAPKRTSIQNHSCCLCVGHAKQKRERTGMDARFSSSLHSPRTIDVRSTDGPVQRARRSPQLMLAAQCVVQAHPSRGLRGAPPSGAIFSVRLCIHTARGQGLQRLEAKFQDRALLSSRRSRRP